MDYTGQIIFLGIDVHKRTYSITAVCEGVVLKQNTFAASPEVLLKYLKNAFKGGCVKSAYEAEAGRQWDGEIIANLLSEQLEDVAIEVHLTLISYSFLCVAPSLAPPALTSL